MWISTGHQFQQVHQSQRLDQLNRVAGGRTASRRLLSPLLQRPARSFSSLRLALHFNSCRPALPVRHETVPPNEGIFTFPEMRKFNDTNVSLPRARLLPKSSGRDFRGCRVTDQATWAVDNLRRLREE